MPQPRSLSDIDARSQPGRRFSAARLADSHVEELIAGEI